MRALPKTPETLILRAIFKDGRKKGTVAGKFLRVTNRIDPLCGSLHEACSCSSYIEGICPELIDYQYTLPMRDFKVEVKKWAANFMASYKYVEGKIIPQSEGSSLPHIIAGMTMSNIEIIDPPTHHLTWEPSAPKVTPSPIIEKIVKKADRKFITRKVGPAMGDRLYEVMFSEEGKKSEQEWEDEKQRVKECPKLIDIVAKSFGLSMWQIAYGKTHGYPHWTARTENLYPVKASVTILKNAANTHQPVGWDEKTKRSTLADEVTPLLNNAHEMLHTTMGTRDKWGKYNLDLDVDSLDSRYLAAASGQNPGPESVHKITPEVTLKVSPNGDKYENHLPDMDGVIQFLRDPTNDPAIYWETKFKTENGFHPGKKFTPEQWEENLAKCRTFVNPSSLFAAMEMMVGQRMKIERGCVIRIGGAWKKGGADTLAYILGIKDIMSAFLPILVEGDVTNFDQRVLGNMVDMYFSMGLIYDDPTSLDYPARVEITKFLIRNLLCRITHLLGPLWAQHRGGVPSGCQNTSHLDSWTMAMWFFLFMGMQMQNASDQVSHKIAQAYLQKLVAIVVYGDDHLYNKSADPDVSAALSGSAFVLFMKKYFDVEIRGMLDGVPFCSVTSNGFLVARGATFLRHQMVLNPYRDRPGQPMFLPFRETPEYVIRAIVGRDSSKPRGPVDMILSILGHAYGTFASNRDAYERLLCLYEATLEESGISTQEALREAIMKAGKDDIETFNKMGLPIDSILSGFPTWETLIKQNEVDPTYHFTNYEHPKWFEKCEY